jgi:hypothetical protein
MNLKFFKSPLPGLVFSFIGMILVYLSLFHDIKRSMILWNLSLNPHIMICTRTLKSWSIKMWILEIVDWWICSMGRIVVYGLSFNYWTDPIRNRIDNLNSYLLHQNLNHMDNHKRSLGTSIIYKRCMQASPLLFV